MDNEIKPRLKAILQHHEGRAKAITRREIKNLLGYQNDRQLRLIIAELRADGLPVLFATNRPAGYYVPVTWAELKTGLDSFRSYIVDLCIQRAKIKKEGALSLYDSKQGVLL